MKTLFTTAFLTASTLRFAGKTEEFRVTPKPDANEVTIQTPAPGAQPGVPRRQTGQV